jgi:hypothetical protein
MGDHLVNNMCSVLGGIPPIFSSSVSPALNAGFLASMHRALLRDFSFLESFWIVLD